MPDHVQSTTVRAPDGRSLCIEIAGEDSETPVLVCAGTPNSRHLYERWIEDAAARGIQLIGYDRPGYGGSDPHPDHTVADGAADVRAIAAGLGLDRIAVWGFSGGGPYALACAALLPDLVVAVGAVCSLAPYGAPDLDFFSGMGEENETDIKLYFSDPEAALAKGKLEREDLLSVTPEQLVEAWRTLLSDVDAQALTGGFAAYVVNSIKDGLEPGVEGWWGDGVAHLGNWGFELSAIEVPVTVLHGRHDRFVPFQHGQWLAEHVPGARAELSETDGHLTLLLDRVSDLHEWLLSHF